MIKHGPDSGNVANQLRYMRLRLSKKRMKVDGENSLDTIVEETIFYKTHVRLKIKTYKTSKQIELEKKALRLKQKKELLRQRGKSYKGPAPKGPGIPIQVPGTVIKIDKT